MKLTINEWNCPDCHYFTSNNKIKYCPYCGEFMKPIKVYYFSGIPNDKRCK